MLRAILALLFAILYLIIGIPVLFVEWIIGKFNRQAADISQLRMVQWAFRVILFICGTKLTIIGEENVPKDQPVLYIGNHRSYFDIIITYSRCPRLTGYVAKDSMKKVPLLSTWMTRLHCLFINRSDVKEALKTILAGIDNIKNGISMCIFPEGTRNKTDDLMLPFKEGSFKMAEDRLSDRTYGNFRLRRYFRSTFSKSKTGTCHCRIRQTDRPEIFRQRYTQKNRCTLSECDCRYA